MRSVGWVAGAAGLAVGLLVGWLAATCGAREVANEASPREEDAREDARALPPPSGAQTGTAPPLVGDPGPTQGQARTRVSKEGRILGVSSDLRAQLATALRLRYALAAEGAAFPDDELEARLDEVPGWLDSSVQAIADHTLWRNVKRARYGQLSDPVQIVLQVSALGEARVPLLPGGEPAVEPLDLGASPTDWSPRVYVKSGVIPAGRALVIEEVDLRLHPGARARARCRLELPGPRGTVLRAGWSSEEHRSRYRGRVVVDEGREEQLVLHVEHGGAEAVLRGHVVERGSAAAQVAPTLTLLDKSGEGLLDPAAVLLQLTAGSNGGNTCSVRLDGSDNGYVTDRQPTSVWREPAGIDERVESRYHVRGAGSIPPGMAFEVQEVVYRAWVAPKRRGRVEIRVGGEVVLASPRSDEPASFQGTWTGSVPIAAGQEESVYVTAAYFAAVEARISGRLVPLGR